MLTSVFTPHTFSRAMKPLLIPVPSNLIEPLESRIAPAIMLIGAIGSGRENRNDTEYQEDTVAGVRDDAFNDLNFVNTSTSADPISVAVDNTTPNSPNTFYVRLDAGDRIDRFTETNNYQELVTVRSGSAIVYFTDLNADNEYSEGELTGLSLSANAVVEINGPVFGDIVTNLDTKGTKDIADDVVVTNGLIGPKQGIKSLNVIGGSIDGSILSGGDISSMIVRGNVENVLAGSAANGAQFDFFVFPLNPNPRFTIGFVPDAGVKGSSIRNAEIVSLTDRLEAGGGGAGAAGGSLTNIQITVDSDSFSLIAGKGGDASIAASRLNGGAGGSITKVLIAGVPDPTPLAPNDLVLIKAGAGGSVELAATTGKGGVGGTVRDVRVGFEASGGTTLPSASLLADNVRVEAGAGGAGQIGGAGGKALSINVRVGTPDVVGPLGVPVAFDEIVVLGGAGGNAVAATGKAGAGGSVDKVEIRNQNSTFSNPDTREDDILVQAGAAGLVASGAVGAVGGSVLNVKLLGLDLQVIAGDGSSGKTGGKGGSVRNITVLDENAILAKTINFHAGRGGDGTAGNAGAGGDLVNLRILNSDLNALTANSGTGGDGGNSTGGKGGKGGLLSKFFIKDIDGGLSRSGTFNVRAGIGGNGDKGGGSGGLAKTLELDAVDLNVIVTGGAGGNALVSGRGGPGGVVDNAQIVTRGSVAGVNVAGSLVAGAGGNAAGIGQAGGKGADVRKSQLNLDDDPAVLLPGDGTIIAGKGGNGSADTGAAGSGGSVVRTAVFAALGSATVIAGDAGAIGGKAGTGGSISGTTAAPIGVRGSLNITARAGDGSFGGAGGSVTNLNYGNSDANNSQLAPTPAGSILVEAGNGSQGSTKAGKGGSITGVNGAASSGVDQTVIFLAGDGGGDTRPALAPSVAAPSGKAAAGGSITNVTLNRGGAAGGLITFEAGDGGDSTTAAKGAAGGQVKGLGVGNIAPEAVLRSIAAGDGGDALRVGGKGGSVVDVQVLGHDIGVRTGEYFGYERMGGIFAGAGGSGLTMGTAGSVTNISADSIAAIVAGKGDIPKLAERISDITLNASNQLLFRNDSFEAGSPFQLTFNGQTTATLPGNATSAELSAALNSLSGVASAGGITVLAFTPDGGYVLQFGSQQLASVNSTFAALNLELALESMPTVFALGGVTTSDQLDGIHVKFNGGGAEAIIPIVVPPGATKSQQIATALNSTGLNTFGAFGVTLEPDGDFQLAYNTFGFGDQSQITGTEFVPVRVLEKIQGTLTQLLAAETRSGEFTLPAAETRSGSDPLTIQDVVRGEINVSAAELIAGDVTASPPVAELQELDLTSLIGFPTGQFTVSFGGDESALISVSDTFGFLKSDVTLRNDIDAALEALPAIQALPGSTVNGKVQTTNFGPRTFDIRFSDLDNDVEPIISRVLRPETQRLDLGNLSAIAGSTFQLNFQGEATGDLSSTAFDFDIDTELEALSTIQALGGMLGDQVSVTQVIGGGFDITFDAIGNQPSLLGATAVPEIQTLDLSTLLAIPGSTFRLNFDGPAIFQNETTPLIAPTGAFGVDASNNLLRFGTAAPVAVTSLPITGLAAGDSIIGVDFRPADGLLYGLARNGSTGLIYGIDAATGVATFITSLSADPADASAPFAGLGGTEFGVDFNPVVDRLRVVSDTGENLRIDVDTGDVTTDDAINGAATGVVGAGYTNSASGAVATTLYTIDSATDQLFIQAPPANGIQTVVGALGIDVGSILEFDIRPSDNSGFLAATVGGVTGLYTVNLTTGAATFVGAIAAGATPVRGLAIADEITLAQAIQTNLNALDSTQDTGANGTVSVTSAGASKFVISFADNGEQNPVVATALVNETQNFDLSSIIGIQGTDFSLDVKTTLPVLETRQYLVVEGYGADSIVRQGVLLNPDDGTPSDPWSTNLVPGTGSNPEVLFVDRTYLINNFSTPAAPPTAVPGRITFTFPATPVPLSVTVAANATAAQLDTAIEGIIGTLDVTINAPGTTTVIAGATIPNSFDVRFAGNADRPNLTVVATVPETQQFDVSNAEPASNTVFHFFNGTTTLDTIVLANTPTATQVDQALDLIVPGGVTVANQGGGFFNVTFNTAGDRLDTALTLTHEVIEHQTLDLSRITGLANTRFSVGFNGITSGLLTIGATDAATATSIDNALDPLITDGVGFNGNNDITVTPLGSGLFEISFTTLRGNLAEVVAQATLGTGSIAPFLPANATAAQIEAALDLITVGGATVTQTATGMFDITFAQTGNQPTVVVNTSIHEIQTLDVFDTGQFSLTFTKDIAYAVDTSNNLVRFELASPSTILGSSLITGLQLGESILGIDARPVDGVIYALGSTNRLYTIDPFTAVASAVDSAAFNVATTGTDFGFDFNPTVDRIRIVSDSNENLRLDPNTGAVVDGDIGTSGTQPDTNLAYSPTDVNSTTDPNVVAIAYDRSDNNPSTPTTLYGIDSVTNSLVRIGAVDGDVTDIAGGGSPNSGVLNTIGFLGFPADNLSAFDIRGATAYATTTFGTISFFFTIDLTTGATSPAQTVGNGTIALQAMTISSGSTNSTTTLLAPPLSPVNPLAITAAELTDLTAKAQATEDALNLLPDIIAAGGVDVEPTQKTILFNGVSTVVFDNTSFDVRFRGHGDMTALAGTQFVIMKTVTTREGNLTTSERQEIRYFDDNAFDAIKYGQANLVGAVEDINEHNATAFRFVNIDGSVDGLGNPTFTLGDQPLDGLVMAKVFDQASVNFTPEARLTADGFFDNDNLL